MFKLAQNLYFRFLDNYIHKSCFENQPILAKIPFLLSCRRSFLKNRVEGPFWRHNLKFWGLRRVPLGVEAEQQGIQKARHVLNPISL